MHVERLLHGQLEKLLLPVSEATKSVTKESLVDGVKEDKDILFYWLQLSIDRAKEENVLKLIHEIASMWLTIREFSRASAWMEDLKIAEQEVKKKNQGIEVRP